MEYRSSEHLFPPAARERELDAKPRSYYCLQPLFTILPVQYGVGPIKGFLRPDRWIPFKGTVLWVTANLFVGKYGQLSCS